MMLALAVALLFVGTAWAEISVGPWPFRIEWKVTPKHTIEGRFYNQYHNGVSRVRLLVEALDNSDRVTDKQFGYVFGDIGALSDRYFEVRAVPAADHYRVTVESYEVQEFPSGHTAPR